MRNVDEVVNPSIPTLLSELKETSAEGVSWPLLAAMMAFRDGDFSGAPAGGLGRDGGPDCRSFQSSAVA
jgi:hypothetical protein